VVYNEDYKVKFTRASKLLYRVSKQCNEIELKAEDPRPALYFIGRDKKIWV
jgi:hypothetical protein